MNRELRGDCFAIAGNDTRALQFTSGEELSALMPSILEKALKGEL
jgi:hypothetical protein